MIKNFLFIIINEMIENATKISKKYFRNTNLTATIKKDSSAVTIADQQIEKKWREIILKYFPKHQIIGEEEENNKCHNDFQWILDPIDGTSSFISGRPSFGNLIALTFQGKAVLGIINQPISGELWLGIDNTICWQQELTTELVFNYGEIKKSSDINFYDDNFCQASEFVKNFYQIANSNLLESGCWFNGTKITTNKNCQNYQEAICYSTSSFYFHGKLAKILSNIAEKHQLKKSGGIYYGGDCYSYGLLASGFVDIVIDPHLQVFDYAALIPIVKMAGGTITNFNGEEIIISNDLQQQSNIIATANPKILETILPILNCY